MMHENRYHDSAVFLTLTYADDFLPDPPSVTKDVWQRYVKRLRKLTGNTLRYFAVGEYGTDQQRPHYHAILFGVSINDHKITDGKVFYGPCLTAWHPRGFAYMGTVTQGSCHYVASYLMKHTVRPNGCQQPFRLMSKGLGKRFALEHKEQLFDRLTLTREGKEIGIPRYYVKKLREHYDSKDEGGPTPFKDAMEAKSIANRNQLGQQLEELGVRDEYMHTHIIRANQQKARDFKSLQTKKGKP